MTYIGIKNYVICKCSNTKSMNNIRVITYNVLSSQLSTVNRYKFPFRRKDINPKYRLEKIKKEITEFVFGRYWDGDSYQYSVKLKNPIFCLQEISIEWYTELKPFFRKLEYDLECTNYGNYHNGDMGVAIAYPKCYEFLDIKIGRVTRSCKWSISPEGDVKEDVKEDSDDSPRNDATVVRNDATQRNDARKNQIINIREKYRLIWEEVKHCKNRYMAIKLKVQEQEFWVATFHMPCSWDCSHVMIAVLMLLLKELKYIVKEDRLILGGDFNFMPDSVTYRFIQTGQVECGDLPLAFGRPYNWKFCTFPLNATEPLPYTTKTISCSDEKEFCGAIDHIFYSKSGIKYIKTECTEFPLEDKFMPNGKHPSDHLPVVAQFQLVV